MRWNLSFKMVASRLISVLIMVLLVRGSARKTNIMHSSSGFQGDSLRNVDIGKREALVYPYSGEVIRLQSPGKSMNSGIVEVYKSGEWGYVCNDGWDLIDASVVCREIGFTRGAISASNKNWTLRDVQRSNASIVINDVQCSGTEKSLLDCPHSLLNDCSRGGSASVECSKDIKCPKHWILGLNKCYKFYTKAKTIQQASNICANDNASLLVINSIKENHFLSNILNEALPEVHMWYTGGKKIHNLWHWNETIPGYTKDTLGFDNINKTEKSNLMEMLFTKWFPGWSSYSNVQAEPQNIDGYDCLTLSNVYRDPFDNTSVLVDYFYWKSDKCRDPDGLNFICQMTINEEESVSNESCYTGDGSTYRGTAAVTEEGQPCQKWSLSSEKNSETNPGKGLGDHNFCRNPDDSNQPWCWVDHKLGTFGVCNLPKCSSDGDLMNTLSLHSANVTVMLVGGSDESEGNVEVVQDNQRYRVCDDNWNEKNAAVICRMMGYSAGGIATKNSLFGNEPANIIMNDVDCSGTETDFSQCSVSMDDVRRNCLRQKYAGAICTNDIQSFTVKDIKYKFKGTCGQRPLDFNKIVQTREDELSELLVNNNNRRKVQLHQGRIIGGQFAKHGEYPWQVRFHMLFGPFVESASLSGYQHCGGAILNQYWVLSAAHCFHGKRADRLAVIVGDNDKTVKDFGEQAFAVDKIFLHDMYNAKTQEHDIALVKIRPNKKGLGIQYNSYAQPVCLPNAHEFFGSGLSCTIAGWGYLNKRLPGDSNSASNGYPDILNVIKIPILNSRDCVKLFKKVTTNYNILTMICAGVVKGGTDTCDGDSGGPLICDISGVYTVVGVTSWGIGCAMPNLPGVYARVSSFIPWIQKTISLNSKKREEEILPPKP